MGAGIPTLLHVNYRSRFHGGFDLAYEGALTWRTPEELLRNLSSLDPETLLSHSRMARAHYENHHTPRILKSLLTGGSSEAPVALPLRDYHPDALQSLLDERKQTDGLRQVTVERDGQIASLNQAVAERDGQIGTLTQAMVERDGQIVSLGQAVVERDGQIAHLSKRLSGREAEMDSLNLAIREREASIAEGLTALNALQAMLDAATTEIAQLKACQQLIEASVSWRITAPLRAMRRMTLRR
jgi:hypothetical protein